MESAYVLANRELEEIRNKNRAKQEMHHAEAVLKVPEIAEVESNLMKQGTRLLSSVLSRSESFEEIKGNIQSLQKKKTALLLENGFPEDFLDGIYSCKECKDSGFVDGRRCVCLKNLIAKHISANSNLTEYMRSQTFENFDLSLFANQGEESGKVLRVMQIILDKALEFAESFDETHENFLIMGNAGTGKTYITSCIANHALSRGKTVYYQTAYKLFESLENAKFNKNDEDAAEIVKYIHNVDLLIIDDLGTEFSTQFTSAALFDIINSRIISKKSTIISSNLGFEELSNTYSERITSRFRGEYKLFQTLGKDLRALIRVRNKKQ